MKKIPHKIKIEDTPINKSIQVMGKKRKAFTIETVFTSSDAPNKHLRIYDSENDLVSWPIPGSVDPKPISIDNVTVEFPIVLVDEEGGNEVILRGYLS